MAVNLLREFRDVALDLGISHALGALEFQLRLGTPGRVLELDAVEPARALLDAVLAVATGEGSGGNLLRLAGGLSRTASVVSRATTSVSSPYAASTVSVAGVTFWTYYTTTASFGMVEASHHASLCQDHFTPLRRRKA